MEYYANSSFLEKYELSKIARVIYLHWFFQNLLTHGFDWKETSRKSRTVMVLKIFCSRFIKISTSAYGNDLFKIRLFSIILRRVGLQSMTDLNENRETAFAGYSESVRWPDISGVITYYDSLESNRKYN